MMAANFAAFLSYTDLLFLSSIVYSTLIRSTLSHLP